MRGISPATTTFVTAAATLAFAAAVASCSVVTSGTPAFPHTSVPTSATAAAPTNPPAPSAPPSDEDQIRQTVMAFQDAYNTQNWGAYTELMCSAMRVEFTGPTMDYLKKSRTQNGLTTVKITSVAISGDTATVAMDAQNEALGSRSVSLPLKLEDGWKICKP